MSGASTYSSEILNARNYTSWLLSLFKDYMGQRVLEVGLGHGGYRPFLADKDYTGVDIDETSIRDARQRDKTGTYFQADIVQPGFSGIVGSDYDTIICFNVIEHIKDDEQAIKNLVSALRPGGHLLLLVPAHESLYSSMDQMAGHHRRYSASMLKRRLPKGIDLLSISYINPVGGLGWWLNKFANHKDLDAGSINRQIILFDKYILPVSRFVGIFTKRFFGQSVICVVKKKC